MRLLGGKSFRAGDLINETHVENEGSVGEPHQEVNVLLSGDGVPPAAWERGGRIMILRPASLKMRPSVHPPPHAKKSPSY